MRNFCSTIQEENCRSLNLLATIHLSASYQERVSFFRKAETILKVFLLDQVDVELMFVETEKKKKTEVNEVKKRDDVLHNSLSPSRMFK